MFTMMNAERLMVGVQGLGIAEAANQKAVAYARERLQGNAPPTAREVRFRSSRIRTCARCC